LLTISAYYLQLHFFRETVGMQFAGGTLGEGGIDSRLAQSPDFGHFLTNGGLQLITVVAHCPKFIAVAIIALAVVPWSISQGTQTLAPDAAAGSAFAHAMEAEAGRHLKRIYDGLK
jgi:hypothetical protein